jgi:hypothetical protein
VFGLGDKFRIWGGGRCGGVICAWHAVIDKVYREYAEHDVANRIKHMHSFGEKCKCV